MNWQVSSSPRENLQKKREGPPGVVEQVSPGFSPGPQQIIPYLQLKQKEGSTSFYQAVMDLQKTHGNQFVQGVLHRLQATQSQKNSTLMRQDAGDTGGETAPGTTGPTPGGTTGTGPTPEGTPPQPSAPPTPSPEEQQRLQRIRGMVSNPGSPPWAQLPEEAKSNLQTLGWNETTWNGNNPPATWNGLWGQLDPAFKIGPTEGPKQIAARALGYTPQTWNGRVRPGEWPPGCSPFIGQVAFYDERDKVREDWTGDAMADQGYYIGYGKKYIQKFTGPFVAGLYSTGTDRYAFIRWTERTRDLLQIAIVRDLINPYTDTYPHIYQVAFDSHPAAYVGGGLGDLAGRAISGALEEGAVALVLTIATGGIGSGLLATAMDAYGNRHGRLGPLIDLLRIMFTVEISDLMKPESFAQVVETLRLLLVNAAQAVWNSIFDPILNPFRDDQARETVRDLDGRGLLGAAPLDKKQLLVEYMIRGMTGDDDENCILTILRSNTGHLKPIVMDTGYERMCNNFHGGEWTSLRNIFRSSLYPNLSQDERGDCLFGLADGRTPEWKEEEMIALLSSGTAQMPYIVSRLGYGTMFDNLSGAEENTFCTLAHSYLYPFWDVSSKVSAVRWHMSGRTAGWAQEEIIQILRSCSSSDFAYIVGQVGRGSLNWDLTGSHQDAFDDMCDRYL